MQEEYDFLNSDNDSKYDSDNDSVKIYDECGKHQLIDDSESEIELTSKNNNYITDSFIAFFMTGVVEIATFLTNTIRFFTPPNYSNYHNNCINCCVQCGVYMKDHDGSEMCTNCKNNKGLFRFNSNDNL